MAIKISNTDVINNSRNLVNITDMDAHYYSYSAQATTITSTINFNTSFMTCTMPAATTFGISGEAEGKSAILILDTTTTPHAPTWPSAINWEDNTEPTWSTYRKWQIHFYVISGTRIDATAIGFDALSSQPTEAISLSGTSGTPITFMDQGSGIQDLVMGWVFDADGNIYKYESIYNVGGQGKYLYSSTQWNNITPSTTYYIKFSNHAGNTMSTSPSSDTSGVGIWMSLATDKKFYFRDSRSINSYADEEGTVKVEISTTSNGSNIVATGYYQCRWSGTA
jgi:hypothetical protein